VTSSLRLFLQADYASDDVMSATLTSQLTNLRSAKKFKSASKRQPDDLSSKEDLKIKMLEQVLNQREKMRIKNLKDEDQNSQDEDQNIKD